MALAASSSLFLALHRIDKNMDNGPDEINFEGLPIYFGR